MDPAVDVTTTTIPDYLTPQGLSASLNTEQPAVIARGHLAGESTLRNYSGPPIPVAISSFLIRDSETGEPFALATVQRDMSERLAAETALRELADQRQALLTRLVDAQDEERAADCRRRPRLPCAGTCCCRPAAWAAQTANSDHAPDRSPCSAPARQRRSSQRPTACALLNLELPTCEMV